MRNSLIISFIIIFIVCFIGGVIGAQRTLSGKINIEPGQVLGASEFFGNPSADTELSIRLLGGKVPESNNKNLIPVKTSHQNELIIDVAAGVVYYADSGKLLFEKDSQKSLPIASITKLATALVFLENNPGWETAYEIQKEDLRSGGKTYLFIGEKAFLKDLFYLSLVGSANTATMALVHSTGMSEDEFVQAMNNKMLEIGLSNTHFSDPVGLHISNVSTAYEVAQLAYLALAKEDIRQAALTKTYDFTTLSGNRKIVKNTDILLGAFPQDGITLLGGKTGYNKAAGYCFVGKFKNSQGREVVAVILGDEDHYSRFSNTEKLVDWVYENYEWR